LARASFPAVGRVEDPGECSAQSREAHLRRAETILNRQTIIGPTAIELGTLGSAESSGAESGEAHRRLAEEPGTLLPVVLKEEKSRRAAILPHYKTLAELELIPR
jgi:hypothetical protein